MLKSVRLLLVLLVLTAVLAGLFGACSDDSSAPDDKDDNVGPPPPEQVLDWTYTGSLWLRYMNVSLPAFDATSGPVSVDVDQFGRMTFGTGTLPYEGEETLGDFRIKRSGTITIRPNGHWFDLSGADHFAVNENSTVNENMKTWVWTGSEWQPVLDEDINSTFNGGLDFNLQDAVYGSGSVVERVEATGTVRWTLVLLPVDSVTAVK